MSEPISRWTAVETIVVSPPGDGTRSSTPQAATSAIIPQAAARLIGRSAPCR